ncbi:MAG: transposase [Candidatus Freyarchaeum deiterrae]
MQEALRYALQAAYLIATRNKQHKIPHPIELRRMIKDWFYSRYPYARHHINPVCKSAVALLKSYRKNHHEGQLRIPAVKKLAARIDAELFKLVEGQLRITLQPFSYVWIPINTNHKKYKDYDHGRVSEVLLTERKVCLTFIIGSGNKPLSTRFAASDLNFSTIDSTAAVKDSQGTVHLEAASTEPLRRITRIQNDFSRRRRRLQSHIPNPQKRARKLKETRNRQRHRVVDALHKLTTKTVRENQDTIFIFENLTGIRNNGRREANKSKKFRTQLNRWPYRLYQRLVDYKSSHRTLYVNPRGTSSRCPVCGGNLEHPAWGISRCETCGVDYHRDRLASLAILRGGLRLCGFPFTVSADASWPTLKKEYLYAGDKPDVARAGWTEPANAPNGNAV